SVHVRGHAAQEHHRGPRHGPAPAQSSRGGYCLFQSQQRIRHQSLEQTVEDSYDTYKEDFISVPYPITKGLEATYEYVAQTRPEIRARKPEDFVDASFIGELDKSGFIKKLYEGK